MIYGYETQSELLNLYYLALWKSYLEEKSIWEPLIVVIYLQKLINTFHKEYLEKLTTTCPFLNYTQRITRLIISKKQTKQKHGRSSKNDNKKSRNWGIVLKLLMNNSTPCGFRYGCYIQVFDLKLSEKACFYPQLVFGYPPCFFS